MEDEKNIPDRDRDDTGDSGLAGGVFPTTVPGPYGEPISIPVADDAADSDECDDPNVNEPPFNRAYCCDSNDCPECDAFRPDAVSANRIVAAYNAIASGQANRPVYAYVPGSIYDPNRPRIHVPADTDRDYRRS